MKFLAGQAIPLFLGQTGIGENFGQIGAQIRYFDVFYVQPPVVGFHIVGEESREADVAGFFAGEDQ